MDNERLPIKFFAPREVDELRVEGNRNSEPPKWLLTGQELIDRSAQLWDAFHAFSDAFQVQMSSPIPFVFVAKMCGDATAKSRRKDIMTLFQVGEKSNVLGLISSDELVVKIESPVQMDEFGSRIQDYEQNSYAISCLETFSSFKPTVQIMEENQTYKIKLIDFQNYETNVAMQHMFEQKLSEKCIAYSKTFYTDLVPVYKIKSVQGTVIDGLTADPSFEMILSIEPMPQYTLSLDVMDCDDNISPIYPLGGHRYETLGILDNGIANIPQLQHWMDGNRWTVYPESVIDATHGTFVAGVALYGDLLENQDWVGHRGIKLLDATIFPDPTKERIDEDDLIANIQEAIKSNHDSVKIWNLSVSITREVSDDKFSDFAMALDALQEQYNILICKSAGNCRNFLAHRPKGRIHEGADSVLSLVVGSMAQEKGTYDFADIDNPSPFTRVGPGPEFIIKPEVAHYGGNAGIDDHGHLTMSGVKSFSNNGTTVRNCGTSFSTPRIAALATGLYQELDEEFDPLLIKGLIIHSAAYPHNLKLPEIERANQIGFGIPQNIRDILYNDPYEATLVLRDTLAKGEYIDIMDFPMPKSLIKNGFYTGQIIATLVYEPILDPSQGIEYCQSNVDLKFGTYNSKTTRDTQRRGILNPVGRQGSQNLFRGSLYSKRLMRENSGDFALRERLLIQYGDKYYPVKKYAIDLSELSEANKQHYTIADKCWYLSLRGLFREHTEQKAVLERNTPSQDFCLILTVRDPAESAPIYNDMTQGLDSYNFWHSNIKLTNDIAVTN